jgi:hypothetical protein
MMPDSIATAFMIKALESLATHPIKTAETFRNAALGEGMFAINPLLGLNQEQAVVFLQDTIRKTVSDGRMIDFGFMPNEMIKSESLRSRPMFEAGELQHPYEEWLAISSWEGGMCGYFISPHPSRPEETLVIELYGVHLDGTPPAILVYDIVSIDAKPEGTHVMPALMQDDEYNNDEEQLWGRGANSLDPLVTMLRLLADASIPITDNPAPEKLNKARVKRGKYAIPPHITVHTRDYVTAFHAAKIEHKSKGGHHASPIAHTRREHKRHLRSGRVVPVRSSRVNWRDSAELHRLFYRVEHGKPIDKSQAETKEETHEG